MSIAHDPPPADHDVAHRGAAGSEHRGVQHGRDGLRGERRFVGIEHHEIGLAALGNAPAGRAPPSRHPCRARRAPAHRHGPAASTLRACREPLRPLELAQLGEGSMQVLESLPTPNAPRVDVATRRERAVAKIRLRGRRESRDRTARREGAAFVIGHASRARRTSAHPAPRA
jgi:hypothetical protein